jgi:hypothetical protein
MDEAEIEKVRRQVAQEYHRVMIDLAMTGRAELPIVKDGKRLVRQFSRNRDNIIVCVDVEEVPGVDD